MTKTDAHIDLKYDEPKLTPAQVSNVEELQDALIRLGYSPGSGTTSYPGKVLGGGTASSPFPTGWSVSSGGTGQYTITHNLGTASYGVVCTAIGTASVPSVQSTGSSTFVVWFYSLAGSNQATDFEFILTLQ